MQFFIDLPTSLRSLVLGGCSPKLDRESNQPKVDRSTGHPIFIIDLFAAPKDGGRVESLRVNIPAKNDPCAGWTEFTPCKLEGLRLEIFHINGNTIPVFTADKIVKAG